MKGFCMSNSATVKIIPVPIPENKRKRPIDRNNVLSDALAGNPMRIRMIQLEKPGHKRWLLYVDV
ncbi:MAG: hypothetical protein KAV87_40625 [Desulfobacteraceae bacterium]|nr:hypothetical protein [Desulfobacteraceae bacterium]